MSALNLRTTWEDGSPRVLDSTGLIISESEATTLLSRFLREKCLSMNHRLGEECEECPDGVGWSFPRVAPGFARKTKEVFPPDGDIYLSWIAQQMGDDYEEFIEAMWQGWCVEAWRALGLYGLDTDGS